MHASFFRSTFGQSFFPTSDLIWNGGKRLLITAVTRYLALRWRIVLSLIVLPVWGLPACAVGASKVDDWRPISRPWTDMQINAALWVAQVCASCASLYPREGNLLVEQFPEARFMGTYRWVARRTLVYAKNKVREMI